MGQITGFRGTAASLAAHAKSKFWTFHDVAFGNPQAHHCGRKLNVGGVPTLFRNGKSAKLPHGIAELEDLLTPP